MNTKNEEWKRERKIKNEKNEGGKINLTIQLNATT